MSLMFFAFFYRLKKEIDLLKQEIRMETQQIFHLFDENKNNQINQLQSTKKTIDKDHEKHYNYLMSLLNLKSIDQLATKLHLLYRGSEHNFECSKFHQLCDGKGKTLVLIRSKTKNLFGGYATAAWHSNGSYSPAPRSFLFSLDKQTQQPIYRYEGNAIYGSSSYGPIFGYGNDLRLYSNCHANTSSYSNLGSTYSLPNNISPNTNEAKSYLAGSTQFQVEEYEVFLMD